ncbi:minor capsid protein [Clostridium botulinum]|uniref:minor capsid protein n=1 Tax=Clostridium botulinum TaxID=1491 RepID=UPI001C9B2843|nr:minor capsid protein [Clostridium botulinum]MBY6797088.1 minor capsid protein [Clostridium botulinum]MBY6866490.1 minor capsid protein [Clostridium botulinum]
MNYSKNEEEKFIQSLYDEANEQLKEVYKEQKQSRDDLLREIALIMLTYTIIDGLMSLRSRDKSKEYKRLSKIIASTTQSQKATQTRVINNILNNTVKNTFNFYSYNVGLKDVKKIIENNFKGKHFSKRIWDNEKKVAENLHKQLKNFLDGKVNVNQIKKDIEKTYNSSAYEARRLVETEVNRCSSNAFDKFCIETGVKKVRYNATLDKRLCSDCAQYHDEVFEIDKKVELPRHPLCRCFYTIEE